MKTVFQCELFKLARSFPFYLVAAVMLAFACITGISNLRFSPQLAQSMGVSQYGFDAFFMALRDTPTVTILGIVLVGILICSDFSNRYVQTVITTGISRRAVVIVKTVVSYAALGIVYLIYTVGRTAVQTVGLGLGQDFTFATALYMCACFLVVMLAHCSIVGLAIIISFAVQSTVLTCGLSILLLVLGGNALLSFGASSPQLAGILALTPFGIGKEIAFSQPDVTALLGYACLTLCFLFIELAVAIRLFCHVELK